MKVIMAVLLVGFFSILVALPIRAVVYEECQHFMGITVCVEKK